MMRSMVLAAELVCRVANTRWPVSAAVSARRMVSRSCFAGQDVVGVFAQGRAQRLVESVRQVLRAG